MMLSCFVIDDDVDSIDLLTSYISETPLLDLKGIEKDPIKALEYFNGIGEFPDLTFLDIEMPKLSGLALARLMKEKTKIIFSTAYGNYAVEAFEIGAIDYLKKPYSYERFLKAVVKAKDLMAANAAQVKVGYIFVQLKENKKVIKVKINTGDIIRIEGMGNYLRIFTISDRNYVFYGKLSALLTDLPNEFVRIHKSHIVNMTFVEVIKGSNIILKNGVSLPVGETFKSRI